ncbi:MAG: hypothetical protein JNN04_00640 [Cyclobacteriaceae bacterium]|nr:hypothetical protein [Cyclobacteriaceae bacterium]
MSSLFIATYPEEIYSFHAPLVVVLNKPWSEQSEPSREALTKLLVAVGHRPESVRMVCQEKLDLSGWSDMPERLVAFVEPQPGFVLNEKISTPTTEMVISEPLDVLLRDETVKRKFWAAFKTLFPA